jgi:hypothetical protein
LETHATVKGTPKLHIQYASVIDPYSTFSHFLSCENFRIIRKNLKIIW